MALGRLDRPRDELGRREGPHRVVDEHDVGSAAAKGLEPGQNALLARRAADRWRRMSAAAAAGARSASASS